MPAAPKTLRDWIEQQRPTLSNAASSDAMVETIDTFIELVFNYPTLSEMYKYAAYDGLGNLAGHKLREG